jgi:dihydroxy-acid dehydratase
MRSDKNVFEAVGRVKAGHMTEEELTSLEQSACPGCGSCAIFKEVDAT